MIVRKPYAFFIKHFRLFHIVFVLLAFRLIVANISLFEFFDNYVSSTPMLVSSYIADSVKVNVIWGILLIIGLSILMGVLIYKKKDIKLYVIEIISYVFVTVLFVISNNIVNNLTNYLVDIRVVKAVHDILFASMFLEAIMIALLFTRATGFDIKRFDFASDYAKINATSEDREEVELNLDFDFNVFKTRFNKFIRNLKYFYLENKLVCLGIVCLALIIIIGSTYAYYKNSPYVNISSNVISANKYVVTLDKVFVDNKDMKRNMIDGSNFIIMKANVRLRGSSRNTFNTSNMMLLINQSSYTPLKKYNQYFEDFGKPYNDDVIEGSGDYYFVYSVPSSVDLTDIKFVYVDVNKYYQKNIDLIDLRNSNSHGNYSVGDLLTIKSSFMDDTDFKIDEVSFKEKFLVPYIYKSANNFYTSSYYVSPSINGNNDKSVMRVMSNACDFIGSYGKIYYDNKKSSVSLKKIETLKKSDYCYFETDYNVLRASNIYLELDVRGNLYKYYLK